MNIYVLSSRKLVSSVPNDPVFELEDLLVETCGAQLLIPTPRGVTRWVFEHPMPGVNLLDKITGRTIGLYQLIDNSLPSLNQDNILFIIGISGGDLNMLSSIPKWRKKFDLVAAYICDAWGPHIYPKYTSYIDHLFVPMPELIEPLQEHFGISVSLLPFGVDVLTHGSGGANRPLDLVSYGRIPPQYHNAFTKAFNQPGSGRIYYRLTPRPWEIFPALEKYFCKRSNKTTREASFGKCYYAKYDLKVYCGDFTTGRWYNLHPTG